MQNLSAEFSIQEKRRFWTDHLASWRSSGLSQRMYCQRHGLSLYTLYYWRNKLAKLRGQQAEGTDVVLVPVTLHDLSRDAPVPKHGPLMVHVGQNFRIEVPGDFDQDVFAKLVFSLARL